MNPERNAIDKDLGRLQGAWFVAGTPGARVIIERDRFVTTGMGAVYEGSLAVDATAKPARIDMKFDRGPEQGNTNRGIYKVKDDSLILCLATGGTRRPRAFEEKPDAGVALQTLVRENSKIATEPPAPAVSAGPATEFEGEWPMISGVMDGKPMEESLIQWVRRVTRGNRIVVLAGPQTMLNVEFTHNATSTPKTIDYRTKGKTQLGIYKIENGVLSVCMAKPGAARPKTFASVRGDGRTLTAWRSPV